MLRVLSPSLSLMQGFSDCINCCILKRQFSLAHLSPIPMQIRTYWKEWFVFEPQNVCYEKYGRKKSWGKLHESAKLLHVESCWCYSFTFDNSVAVSLIEPFDLAVSFLFIMAVVRLRWKAPYTLFLLPFIDFWCFFSPTVVSPVVSISIIITTFRSQSILVKFAVWQIITFKIQCYSPGQIETGYTLCM